MNLKFIGILLIGSVLTGCAAPARIDQMSASTSSYQSNSALKGAVGVADVTGGKDTSPMWTSQVSSEAFRRALENSLKSAGLHNPILSGSKFQLKADLVNLDQPLGGFNMTVSATVRYSLVEEKSGKEVYARVIPSSHTAKMAEAFSGAERLRLANEGAIKVNLQFLVDDLARLKL